MRQPKPVRNKKQRAAKKLQVKRLILTPAERAEAARFEALTRARAARQAKVRRIAKQLQRRNDSFGAV